MFIAINAAAVVGIEAYRVRVEVHIANGLRKVFLVGLPDGAIRESLRRVESAIHSAGYDWPAGQITINLSPAGLRKDGTGFDLPIALAVLLASRQIDPPDLDALERIVFAGELSLDGTVLPVPGVLPRATLARDLGLKTIAVPRDNAAEAAVVRNLDIAAMGSLGEAATWVTGEGTGAPAPKPAEFDGTPRYPFDFSEVRGQAAAKRALEIAAAGGHNALMIGPPGTGKTMLARRLVTILPPLSRAEAIETTKIYSVAGALPIGHGLLSQRPFCAPHFTISEIGISGGGSAIPRPGQISLAHNGVLFLDELPEFPRHVLEVMRGPLEDKQVTLTRGMVTVTYPASFMMVAAMNPCPCGYHGSTHKECTCTLQQVQTYRQRVSGPLLDRIDLQTTVSAVPYAALVTEGRDESSSAIRERVAAARWRQQSRLEGSGIHCNAEMAPRHLRTFCRLDGGGHRLLERCIDVLGMSARGYSRILKVSRTIADLEGATEVAEPHVAEAIGYRHSDEE